MHRRKRTARLLAVTMLASCLVVVAGPPAGAAAPTGELTIVSRGISSPKAIVAAPDGNLWFADFDAIGRMTPAGALSSFSGTDIGYPGGLTVGPDGNLWFTRTGAIGRITPAGVVSTFSGPGILRPVGIATGPDGHLWFTDEDSIGRMTPTGVVVSTFVDPGIDGPESITAGPDGNMWFTNRSSYSVGRITAAGVVANFKDYRGTPTTITAGPDGNLWFTNNHSPSLGRVTPAGVITNFAVPDALQLDGITAGPDGNVWFTNMVVGGGVVGRITPAGVVSTFPLPRHRPFGIVSGPGGDLWFASTSEYEPNAIGRITTAGSTSYLTGPPLDDPHQIVTGPDGNLWFTNSGGRSIGRLTPAGALTTFTGSGVFYPTGITTGPDGNLWFVDLGSNLVGRITPSGAISTFSASGINRPYRIVSGPDGNLWFTNLYGDSVGRITPAGVITIYTDPAVRSPLGIVAGPDGNVWFTSGNTNSIGRITPAGVITTFTGPGVDGPGGLALGGDGNLWFTSRRSPAVGRVTPAGAITVFTGSGIISPSENIAAGPDGNLWFTNSLDMGSGSIARITSAGVVSTFTAPSTRDPFGITAGPDGNMWFTTRAGAIGFIGTGLPGPPPAPVATAGNGSATVSWSAPPSDGGSPVTGYTVTASPGGRSCTWIAGPLQCSVSGLSNGRSYTFSVAATNVQGTGPASGPSSSVAPTVPVLFHPLTPTRILDPRPAGPQVGPYGTPWTAGQTRDVSVAGLAGIPAGADSVVLNVTVTGTTAAGYLTVWPAGEARPLASSLNWAPNQTVANAVTVRVGAGGKVSVLNPGGSANVIVDAVGWYDTAGGDGFTPLTPARILDSRLVGPAGTPWTAGQTRDVPVTGVGGVAAAADAVVVNLTVTGTTAGGYLTVWPAGQPRPLASSISWAPGQTVANAVTVRAGVGGRISVFNPTGSAHVIVDVVGSFTPSSGLPFHALSPARIQDSRPAGPQTGPYGTPWGPSTSRDVQVSGAGAGGVPADAAAALLNLTATGTTATSYLTVAPAGQAPLASSLNWQPGQTVPNSVTAKLGPGGAISVRNPAGNVDVIADAAGWYGYATPP